MRLGIQQGSRVVMDVPADNLVAYFPFSLKVVPHSTTGAPRFKGVFAQGPAGGQFVYLCWGTRNDEKEWITVRRAKIPLYNLTWDVLLSAAEQSAPLRTRIRMTDRKGEPVTATVNPEDIEWL